MQTLFKDELWGVGGELSWGNEMENEIAPANSPSLHNLNTVCLHTTQTSWPKVGLQAIHQDEE